jgi:HSP20 family protein
MSEAEARPQAPRTTKGEPFDPLDVWPPFDSLRQELDRLLDRFDGGYEPSPLSHPRSAPDLFWAEGHGAFPATGVWEREHAYEVIAELPGLERSDIQVKLSNGCLVISGEKRQEAGARRNSYRPGERRHGSFERSFLLPEGVEAEGIDAQFEMGVLTITMPKKTSIRPPERKVEVRAK